ncbi:MAG: phosphoribosylamine--glycine ligase [Polyangiaceae bacterium]
MSPSRTVLVVGSGSREHALAAALASEGHRVLAAPGNAGTATVGENVAVAADDLDGIANAAVTRAVDLVVVGPEVPLTLGLVDVLAARGVRAFGPSKAAAELEGSKAFMKRFLERHGIPTAPFQVFEDETDAIAFVRAAKRPLVVKTDGLAAGKGVVVAEGPAEAEAAIVRAMRDRVFGDAGKRVIVEEMLRGEEASFHVVADGTRYVVLVSAQDHKRVFEGDRGPNTGGMGAYAPAPVVTGAVHDAVLRTIVEPTLRGMEAEGRPFRGVLFVGLMIDAGVPTVVEFNVRFGDPETTVLVPMLDGSWFDLLDGAARGNLDPTLARTRAGAALAVVLAAEGYPGKVTTGDAIHGLGVSVGPRGTFVFHAGTKTSEDGSIVTSGGRVLTVVGVGEDLRAARDAAYRTVAGLSFRGAHHRRDIGHRALGAPGSPAV